MFYLEKNARRELYQGFKWKRMLVPNLTFEMKENARHEHHIDSKWSKMCVANRTNANMKLYIQDHSSF